MDLHHQLGDDAYLTELLEEERMRAEMDIPPEEEDFDEGEYEQYGGIQNDEPIPSEYDDDEPPMERPPLTMEYEEQMNTVPPLLNTRNGHFFIRFQRTFRSPHFNLVGNAYSIAPQETRRRSSNRFHGVTLMMNDLEYLIQHNIDENDYVQLIFHHRDLDEPYIMPVVRVSLFDKAVAETQFENIMTSNE